MTICRTLSVLLILVASQAPIAIGGGIERAVPTTRALFEEGRYLELSWFNVAPELSGRGGLLDPTGAGSGDLLQTYDLFTLAYKADFNERWAYSFVIDQPWGVNTQYPIIPTSGYSGTSSELKSDAFSGILSFRVKPNISIYSGVRMQSIEPSAAFPFGGALGLGGPYSVVGEADEGVGFLAGLAFEYPELAARLAFTYYSEIEHTHDTTEVTGFGTFEGETTYNTPQIYNLEFQSGIAQDTLAFGSIRWVDWSSFAIAPPVFTSTVGVPLVEFTEDWTTYTLGVGHKFNDFLALAVQCTYEPDTGQELTTLGPIDGRFSYGIAPAFTLGQAKLTVGVSRVELGRAVNFAGTEFDDGDALVFGMRLGWNM